MAKKAGIVLLCFVVVSTALLFFLVKSERQYDIVIRDVPLRVLVARSAIDRSRGLSGIEQSDLKADGMLFVFEQSHIREFWMKDMNFGLDVLWIEDNKIVKMDTHVFPALSGEPITRMSSDPFMVQHVLELPAGSVFTYGIKVGDEVNFGF